MRSAQELLRGEGEVRTYFERWGRGKFTRSVEQQIDRLMSQTWKAFVRSQYGKECSEATGLDLGSFGVESAAAAGPVRRPAAPPSTPPVSKPAAAPQPVINVPGVEQPVAPVAPPTVSTSTTSPSTNPLIALIADGLRDMGYSPASAITAEQARSISEDAALQVAEMVTEQLRGELGTQRQVIEIREPGREPRQVEGHAPAWFGRLVKLAQCRVPALMVGPAGCGKTTAVKRLAEAMGLPFHRVSLAAGTDEGQLQGWLHPVGDHMRFEYVASVVSQAYEQGGIVLIDDIDLGDPNALGILNAALDNGGWHIPLRHHDPVFRRHADFYLCGAANTWGHGADRQYSGANQLDERTLSRFRAGQIRCDYDEALEAKLYGNHKPGAEESLRFGHRLRARCRALPGWTRDVSTRDIEAHWIMLDQFSVAESWYGQFADWSEEECTRVHAVVDHDAMTAILE